MKWFTVTDFLYAQSYVYRFVISGFSRKNNFAYKGPVIIYHLGGVGGFWAKHDEI